MPRPGREVGEDRHVVAAFVHRLDGLLHVDRIVAGAGPRRVHVVAFPEGRGRQHDVGVARRRRQEMVLRHDQLHAWRRDPDRRAAPPLVFAPTFRSILFGNTSRA